MSVSLLAIAKYTYDRYLVPLCKIMLPSMLLALVNGKGINLPDAITNTVQFSTILALCAWCLSGLRVTKQFMFSALIGVLLVVTVGCFFEQVEGRSVLLLILCAVISLKLFFARYTMSQDILFRENAYIIHEYHDGRGYFITQEKLGFNGYCTELVDFAAINGQSHCVFKTMDEAKHAILLLDHQEQSTEQVAS